MPDSLEVRLARFEVKLDRIIDQVEKTNGRVTKLEHDNIKMMNKPNVENIEKKTVINRYNILSDPKVAQAIIGFLLAATTFLIARG